MIIINEKTRNKNKKRLYYVDLLESIAIIFVMLYHCTNYNWDIWDNKFGIIYLRYYCRTILSCGVPLFFFANGYLLLNHEFNLKKHIQKNFEIYYSYKLMGGY